MQIQFQLYNDSTLQAAFMDMTKLRKLFPLGLPGFDCDPVRMDARLQRRLSKGEFAALALTIAMTGVYVWAMQKSGVIPFDYSVFMNAPQDHGFRYGYWIVPVFQLFQAIPFVYGYVLWCILGIVGVFFAARVFGGNAVLALASYQMLSLLFYGNFSAVLVGGMGLFWFGMAHKKWVLAGLGFLLAATKYHFIFFIGLPLIWWLKPDWRTLLKVAIAPVLIGIATLFLYPTWVPDVIQNLQSFDFNSNNTVITLWSDLGFFSLVFWIPVLLLPFTKNQRLFAMLVTAFIASPYWLEIDLLILFVFPIGLWPLFGLVGLLNPVLVSILPVIKAMFLVLYGVVILPPLWQWVKSKRKKT